MGYNWLISCNKYSVEKHTIKSWKFNSTLQILAKKTNKKALVVGLTVGSIVLVGGLALLGFVLWKKRIAQEEDEEFTLGMSMDNEFEASTGPKKFWYGEFFRATNNFAEDQKLGEGGFGGVYRGFLRESNPIRNQGLHGTKMSNHNANEESDVYSSGIVALEIACGKKLIDLNVPESQMRMVEWVWDFYGAGRLLDEAIDPTTWPYVVQEEMECLMMVGLWCAHPDHNLRPSIKQANSCA
ncbi:unnamed protein product [Camellia sinensis]